MRRALVLTSLLLAAASSALAATASKDPLALALQKSDFPSGVFYSASRSPASGLSVIGKGLKGVNFQGSWKAGGTVSTSLGPADKEWLLEGDVIVAPTATGAKGVYALGKGAQIGFFNDFPQPIHSITLPRYGDEQFAFAYSGGTGGGGHAAVFVRKGSVVWEVRTAPVPFQWKASEALAIAQLKIYAAREKTRVGAG
jgi:hypothetical protein